ncbi:MAG TPA: hypothetical protein VJL60_00815 [Gammaproteobacteria bacterium]|nr:hypothetical protein [Gammaproteobacteria bacterium]
MRYWISVMIVGLLTACGGPGYQYQSEQNSGQWQGQPIQAVQQQWGAADQTLHTRSGISYYAYTTHSGGSFLNSTTTNFSMSPGSDDSSVNFPMQGQYNSMSLQCVTIFKTDPSGIIVDIIHQGNNCGGEWVPTN